MYTVYILYSLKLHRFYVGYTSDLSVRLDYHLSSESTKYNYKADDWVVYYTISEIKSKETALKIERHIKSMKSRKYIENLLKYPEITQKLLLKYG